MSEEKNDGFFALLFGISVAGIFLCLVLIFFGCSSDNPYVDAWNEGVANAESQLAADQVFRDQFVTEYFEKVGEDSEFNFVLYRDVRTDVMYFTYVSSAGYGRGAALSVMYAADGSPLLYPEWLVLCADQEVPGSE